MPYLLDTNIISALRRTHPDPRVAAWYATIRDDSLYLSVLVVGEIRQGIERLRRRDGSQARVLDQWLATLKDTYTDRIVSVSSDMAEEWGRLNALDPLPYIDGLMAATARVHDWTLATRNTKHVERTGVQFVNPFEFSGT